MSGGFDRLGDHPAFAAVAEIDAGLDDFTEANLWSMPDADVLALRADLARLTGRLAAATLAATRQLDISGAGVASGAASAAGWLRGVCRVDPRSATREVKLAAALSDQLAATGAALSSGTISMEHAVVIRHAIDSLPIAVDSDTRTRAEEHLLEEARRFDPESLARLGRHLRHVLDPDPGAKLEADESEAARNQTFSLAHRHDGTRAPRGCFTAEAGAFMDAALDAVSGPRPGPDGAPDPRGPGQRRADGLLEIFRMAMGAPDMPEHGGEPVAMTVTVPFSTLEARLSGDRDPGCKGPHASNDAGVQAGELADGSPISAETARRLACDAWLIPAVLGSTSEVLDIGRMARAVPRPMRRALIARDRGCAFPGCGRPPKWCHAHHVWHWALGGPTSLDNLVLLCGRHHRAVHHEGWRVHIGPDGLPVFTPPRWIDPGQRPRPAHHRPWRESLEKQPLLT
jgi:hypothetical protein